MERQQVRDLLPAGAVASSDGQGWGDLWMARHRIPGTSLETPAFPTLLLTQHVAEVRQQFTRFAGKTFEGTQPAGSFALLPPETPAQLAWAGAEDVILLTLSGAALQSVYAQTQGRRSESIDITPQSSFQDGVLQEIVRLIYQELMNNALHGRIYRDSLTLLLGVHLLQEHCWVASASGSVPKRLSRRELSMVISFVHDNIGEDLSLASAAAEAGYSAYHLHRLFRQTMGRPLHQYVIEARVEKAASLLARGGASVATIATQVGFADQTHLTRHCKRILGTTPARLLPQNQAGEKSKIRRDSVLPSAP